MKYLTLFMGVAMVGCSSTPRTKLYQCLSEHRLEYVEALDVDAAFTHFTHAYPEDKALACSYVDEVSHNRNGKL